MNNFCMVWSYDFKEEYTRIDFMAERNGHCCAHVRCIIMRWKKLLEPMSSIEWIFCVFWKTWLNRIHFISFDIFFKLMNYSELPFALTCFRRPTIYFDTLCRIDRKFIYVMNSNTNLINGQTVLLPLPIQINSNWLVWTAVQTKSLCLSWQSLTFWINNEVLCATLKHLGLFIFGSIRRIDNIFNNRRESKTNIISRTHKRHLCVPLLFHFTSKLNISKMLFVVLFSVEFTAKLMQMFQRSSKVSVFRNERTYVWVSMQRSH